MICNKCKTDFICNKEDIINCHCFSYSFNDKINKFIKTHYNNCLCNKCLNNFLRFEDLEQKESLTDNKEILLKEDIHYKTENSLWVFSEYYHYLRGKCCKNNCRNCIYPKKSTQ